MGVQDERLNRTKIRSYALYRIFNIFFAVLFAIVAVQIVFNNATTWVPQSWWLLLIAALAGTLAIFIITRAFFLIPEPRRRLEFILVPVLMVGLFALQLAIVWNLWPGFTGDSDYSQIYLAAQDFVKERFVPTTYLGENPGNAGLYVLWCMFFSILDALGQADYTLPTMVFNALAIDGAVLLMYFCARRLFGGTKALFLIIASFFIYPFVAGAVIACSDTIVLPIPIAAVLLWLHARSNWREGTVKKAFIQACIAGALLGVGALFKLSILVVWIAIAVDILILLCGRKRMLLLLASFAAVAVFTVGLGALVWVVSTTPSFEGLQLMPGAAASEATTSGFGVFDTIMSYLNRLSNAFGDGTFGLAGGLNQAVPSPLNAYLIPSGTYFDVISYIAFGLTFGVLLWMLISALKSIYRKNDALSFARVAVFGLTLYLLIWGAGSRTLICLLPFMMLCALESAPIRHNRIAEKRVAEAQHAEEIDFEKEQMRNGTPRGKALTQSMPLVDRQPLPESKIPAEIPDYMNPSYGLAKPPEEQDPEELLQGALGYAHSLAAEREKQPKELPPESPADRPKGDTVWDIFDDKT